MKDALRAPRRALVVIDVQDEYVSGGLPIEHPPVATSLAAIGRAMDAASEAGVPVVVVQNTAPAGSPIFAAGTPGWQLHPVVAGRPHDHRVEKRLPDAFAETDLGRWLVERGVDTLAIAGYMTHNCVDSTAKHALHAGYRVEVLVDAIGAVSYLNDAGRAGARQIHEAFTVVMQSRFAAVMPVAEWLEVLAGRREPRRDSISASSRRAREAA
jgi:nicotinamidase-related amidase